MKSLDHQRERLANLRTRSATLLAAAAIATSLLGTAALRADQARDLAPSAAATPALDGWEVFGVSAFLGLALLVVVTLLPWRWKWHTNATALIRDYVEGANPASVQEMQRDLALHYEASYRRNDKQLRALYWCFRLSCLLLALEVLAWILDLGVD